MLKNFFSDLFKQEPVSYGRDKISELIIKFVYDDVSLDDYEWDNFTSSTLSDPYEEFIQTLTWFIEGYFPARHRHEWCNDEGGKALIRLADAISSDSLPFPPTEEELIELVKEHQIPFRYKEIIQGM